MSVLVLIIVNFAVILAVLGVPMNAEQFMDGFRFGAPLAVSFLLLYVTQQYASETTKMARASEKQTDALLAQLEVDLVPKLICVIDESGEPGRFLRLVNLSRHPIWLQSVEIDGERDAPFYGRTVPLQVVSSRDLQVGEGAFIAWSPSVEMTWVFSVDFFYGPTGHTAHRKFWHLTFHGQHRLPRLMEGALPTFSDPIPRQ